MTSTPSNIEAETTVRALYDYFSPDDTNLQFRKGDLIRVFTKLESGWCHGEKGGERGPEKGWFPINFVEFIDLSTEGQRATFMRNMSISSQRQNTSPNETFQLDRTNSWLSQSARGLDANTFLANGVPETNGASNDGAEAYHPYSENSSRRPSRLDDWEPHSQIPSLPKVSETLTPDNILPMFCPPGDSLSDINTLPPNWCKKISASNKVYYFNMLTDESDWELPPDPKDTSKIPLSKRGGGRRFSLASEHSGASVTSEVTWMNIIPAKAHRTLLFGSGSYFEPNLNWDGIVSNVVCAVYKLTQDVARRSKSNYLRSTCMIIESIRLMLLASGTAERDSPVFKSHQLLHLYHRTILLSLCDLILISKVAAGIWPPPDMAVRLEAEANTMLILSRHFVQVAQQSSIGVKLRPLSSNLNLAHQRQQSRSASQHAAQPTHRSKLSNHGSIKEHKNLGINASHLIESRRSSHDLGSEYSVDQSRQTNRDILSRFDSGARSTGIAIECLTERLVLSNDINQQLIALIKLIIKEVGQFIGLLDIFTLEGVSSELSAMFNTYRQTLYENLSMLVLVTQSITDAFSQSGNSSTDQISATVNRIEKSINDLLIAIKFVLEERDLKEYCELRRKLAAFTSMIRSTPKLKENGVEFPPPLRRSFSLSSLSTSMATSSYSTYHSQNLPRNGQNLNLQDSGEEDELEGESDGSGNNGYKADLNDKSRKEKSDKLKKILGTEAPSGEDKEKIENKETTGGIKPPEEKPWFLGHDYTPQDLVFEGTKVRGGTVNGLVECLTFHDNWDPNFMATFLLTYRSFMTTSDLFKLLFKRFSLEPPLGLTQPEYELWYEKKLTVIRIRVFNILKTWVETYFQENDDMEALEQLRRFASTVVREALPSVSEQLLRHIEKRLDVRNAAFKKMIKKSQEEPPSIVPRSYNSFIEMDPLEIARQLTLIDSELFNQIKPVECLDKAWSRKDDSAPNIKKSINMSTQISNWVAFTILSESNIRFRGAIIKHFIAIAEKCLMLHNFNTLMSLVAGLNTAPIHRLRRTWEGVTARSVQTLDIIKQLMESTRNFGLYREKLHSVNPPCVPFLGLYLTDLTFIADGNSDNLSNTELINFFKQAKSADIIREIQQFQNSIYYLKLLPKLREYLLKKMELTVTQAQLYDRSLELEPREREEEKIARLLQESGFL